MDRRTAGTKKSWQLQRVEVVVGGGSTVIAINLLFVILKVKHELKFISRLSDTTERLNVYCTALQPSLRAACGPIFRLLFHPPQIRMLSQTSQANGFAGLPQIDCVDMKQWEVSKRHDYIITHWHGRWEKAGIFTIFTVFFLVFSVF